MQEQGKIKNECKWKESEVKIWKNERMMDEDMKEWKSERIKGWKDDTGCPKKHGNSVTNSISSLS